MGKNGVKERNDNYEKIMNKMVFTRNSQFMDDDDFKKQECMCLSPKDADTLYIDGHDFVLFFGDLNYRLDFEMEEMDHVYTMIEKKMYAQLLVLDQLMVQRLQGNAFDGFEEHGIEFAPTYKFKQGGHKYAYDKRKNRMP